MKVMKYADKKIKSMNAWHIACLKIYCAIFGVVLGAYISEFVKEYLVIFIVAFGVFLLPLLYKMFKKEPTPQAPTESPKSPSE